MAPDQADAELLPWLDPPVRVASLFARGVTIVRMSSDRSDLPPGPVTVSQDAFSVIVQLRGFEDHRLWRNGKVVYEGAHQAGALAITDLRDTWRCHHRSAFDNVRFSLPRSFLATFAQEHGRRPFRGLDAPWGEQDVVVWNIAQALLPALLAPQQANQLFVDQMILGLAAHLLATYGADAGRAKASGLTQWQKTRAMDYMAAHSLTDISIADVAADCRLSRSYFIKAFREATGRTPHRWMLEHRVAEAKALLLRDLPIAEVATACGFSDQSHLTRVFTAIVGSPPGRWRRSHRP